MGSAAPATAIGSRSRSARAARLSLLAEPGGGASVSLARSEEGDRCPVCGQVPRTYLGRTWRPDARRARRLRLRRWRTPGSTRRRRRTTRFFARAPRAGRAQVQRARRDGIRLGSRIDGSASRVDDGRTTRPIRPLLRLACLRICRTGRTQSRGESCRPTRIRSAARSCSMSEGLVRVLPASLARCSTNRQGRRRSIARLACPLPELDAHLARSLAEPPRWPSCSSVSRSRCGDPCGSSSPLSHAPSRCSRSRVSGSRALRQVGSGMDAAVRSSLIGDVLGHPLRPRVAVACGARAAPRVVAAWLRGGRFGATLVSLPLRVDWGSRSPPRRLSRARTRGGWSCSRERLGACHCSVSVGGWPGVPLARPLASAREERWGLAARAVPRFSALAVVSIAALLTAGVINGFLEVRSWSGLWETTYGRLLLVKVALVLPVLALGAFNNRVSVPRLRARIASALERRRFLVSRCDRARPRRRHRRRYGGTRRRATGKGAAGRRDRPGLTRRVRASVPGRRENCTGVAGVHGGVQPTSNPGTPAHLTRSTMRIPRSRAGIRWAVLGSNQ